MDFFTQQEKSRKKTGVLLFFFICAVALIIAALYAAVTAVLLSNHAIRDPLQPEILLCVAGGTLAIVIAGSLFKTAQLRRGGVAVAEMLGAEPVSLDTKNPKEKQLLNVVEEMAIASGTPVPSVYTLDEPGINAFAAGWGTPDAVVCVTTGSLDHLSRDELQGVVAHEFSHILNGDMRLNIRLMGFIFGILVLGQIGYWVLRGSGRGRVRVSSSRGKGGGGGAVILIALALFVIGYIGVFFGNLIQAAVSRAREFLADASAVQFTRNPSGIGGALRKIGGLVDGGRITHHNTSQAGHFFFANALSGFMSSIFATHPPLEARIKAIDPAFDGEFPVVKAGPAASESPHQEPVRPAERPADRAQGLRFDASLLVASAGAVTAEHVAYSAKLLNTIPNGLRTALLDTNGAQAVVFGLLLSGDAAVRASQLTLVSRDAPLVAQRIEAVAGGVAQLDRNQAIPVASIAISSLKSMSAQQYGQFVAALKAVIEADERIELFEYMIQRMVRRNLEPRFSRRAQPDRLIQSLSPLSGECAALFSILAWESAESPQEAQDLFNKACGEAGLTGLALCDRTHCSLQVLDTALERLALLVPLIKRKILNGCVAIASADNVITVNEAEYLRAIADGLGCPIPPMITSSPV